MQETTSESLSTRTIYIVGIFSKNRPNYRSDQANDLVGYEVRILSSGGVGVESVSG